jgi:hypothetical protein
MLREWKPKFGEVPIISPNDCVLITGYNGVLTKVNKKHIVIDLMLANIKLKRYYEATITIDFGIIRHYHNYRLVSREEFLIIVQAKYPAFFEYLLFHPEYTK